MACLRKSRRRRSARLTAFCRAQTSRYRPMWIERLRHSLTKNATARLLRGQIARGCLDLRQYRVDIGRCEATALALQKRWCERNQGANVCPYTEPSSHWLEHRSWSE